MRAFRIGMAAMVAAAGWAGTVAAAPCYVVFDRDNVMIFRDTSPPFDLSDPKSPERAALRQRGQHLLIAEFDHCNGVGYISATTGGSTASVDDIVSQLQPAIATQLGSTGNARPGMTPANGARPAPAAAPARSGASSAGGGVRSY